MGGKIIDATDAIIESYERNHLDVLVCLGGGGTQKAALKLKQHGLNIITLPKTIDNDVAMTDVTFGFDTALGIATEAIDRLHSTAHSHHRIVVVEIMGHRAGWLALGAGIAGGGRASSKRANSPVPKTTFPPTTVSSDVVSAISSSAQAK